MVLKGLRRGHDWNINPEDTATKSPITLFGCDAIWYRYFSWDRIECILNLLVSTLFDIQPTVYTVHFILYTLYTTLYTLHYTLCTVPSTLYTVHCALYPVHCTQYKFTLYTVQYAVNTVQFRVYTVPLHKLPSPPQDLHRGLWIEIQRNEIIGYSAKLPKFLITIWEN